jgi:tetratricopeptide (TPR) repeat protein
MLRNVIIVILLAGVVLTAQAQTINSERTLERLKEAVAAIKNNQWSRAETLLNDVLTSSPGDSNALNLLGVIRARQDRKAEAEQLFRRALINSPSNATAYINLGELLITTNRSAEALPILVRGQKLIGNIPAIELKIATLYAEQGNYRQALEYLNLLPAEAFTDDYFLLMLRSLIGLKRLENVPGLTSKFRQAGLKPETQAEFAMLLAKAGFNDNALEILEDAQRKTPASFPILYGLGVVKAALKDQEKANEYLTAALCNQT